MIVRASDGHGPHCINQRTACGEYHAPRSKANDPGIDQRHFARGRSLLNSWQLLEERRPAFGRRFSFCWRLSLSAGAGEAQTTVDSELRTELSSVLSVTSAN